MSVKLLNVGDFALSPAHCGELGLVGGVGEVWLCGQVHGALESGSSGCLLFTLFVSGHGGFPSGPKAHSPGHGCSLS